MATNNGSPAKTPVGSEIDKEFLYGKHDRWEDAKQKLALRAAHKALDMAVDDMDIDASRKNYGIGTAGLIGVALAAGLPAALLGLALLLTRGNGNTPLPSQQGPVDSNYTVRFYDKDGKPIAVPHISEKPK